MTPKENYLRAISYDSPQWVPRTNEGVVAGIGYAGNFQVACWTDAWGTRWETTRSDMVPFPKGNPLEDITRIGDFVFPDPRALLDADESLAGQIAAIPDRDERIVLGHQTYFLFERAWALTGMESFMAAFHEHPEELRELLRRIADFNIAVFERYIELGADGISFSEDLGTQRALMISPKQFREFIKPEYERIFAPVKAVGKLVNFHSCGCVDAIIKDLIDVGVDVLNPVQARANDLAAVKAAAGGARASCPQGGGDSHSPCGEQRHDPEPQHRRPGWPRSGRLALEGGVDTQHVLMRGTPEEVEEEVKRVLGILAPGGGFIIGPDQGMPFPPENISALWAAAEKWGKYPLELG